MINKDMIAPGTYDYHVKYIPMFKMRPSVAFSSKQKKTLDLARTE